MITIRSFRSRTFLALFLVGVVPALVAVGVSALVLRQSISAAGTAGPWDAIAESGRTLIEAVEARVGDPDSLSPEDSALVALAERHRDALSISVRQSALFQRVSQGLLGSIPILALGLLVAVGLLAFFAAQLLSKSLARPIAELLDWTERIAKNEPLPAPTGRSRGARDFEVLRRAFRSMSAELAEGRRREIEAAKLRSWTEMARRVAHELKNPLTPMRMALASIERSDDPSVKTSSEVLAEEIARLDEMARSFAQFGQLPEGPPAPVDLVELLEGLADRHGTPGTGITVSAEGEIPLVSGHHEALVRVFRNLIANAVEAVEVAGTEGGRVRIGLRVDEERERAGRPEVVVVVDDDGPGIPDGDRERIWEPDFTSKRRGTGLGLPLVRRTVEAHGGEVRAGTSPLGGARFEVALPLAGSDPARRGAASPSSGEREETPWRS